MELYSKTIKTEEDLREVIDRLQAWCDAQDAISKGESMTTRQVRRILKGESK